MKRAPRLTPLPISLDPASSMPLWRQVAIGLRVALSHGRLGTGGRLPSTRALARQLNVSRNTVIAAYDELAALGLLHGSTGDGSYVTGTPRPVAPRRVWFQDASGNLLALTSLS